MLYDDPVSETEYVSYPQVLYSEIEFQQSLLSGPFRSALLAEWKLPFEYSEADRLYIVATPSA